MTSPDYTIPAWRVQLVREGPSSAAPRPLVSTPGEAAQLLLPWVHANHDDGREAFGVLMLDARHRLIGLHVVGTGCLTASIVHPREVFGPALVSPAAGLVLWHTHPSGDPEPSGEDMALTRRLAAAGELLGVQVLDHIILGMGSCRWVSLKDRGAL